jgi:hypothetical protein
LEEQERSISWLARKIGEDKDNLTKRLKSSPFIYYDLVYKISQVLNEDLFAYGSQKLNKIE